VLELPEQIAVFPVTLTLKAFGDGLTDTEAEPVICRTQFELLVATTV
jgi:hypothetical protein